MHILNIILLLIYGIALRWLIERPNSFFNQKNLIRLYIPITLFSILAMNAISFVHTGNFFVFSVNDATLYRDMGKGLNFLGDFQSTWSIITSNYSSDDWGMMIFSGIVYTIFDHPLFLNFINFLLGIVIAKSVFSIGLNFMSRKYAFLAGFSFATASFLMWFHSSGMKETVMITLIVLTFSNYYSFLRKKSPQNVVLIVSALLLLLLFRPAVTYLIAASIATHSVFIVKDKILKVIIGSIVVVLMFFSSDTLLKQKDNYFGGGSLETLIEWREKQGMVKGGFAFTYIVNATASLIGPLPTIPSSSTNGQLSFFAPGLLFRSLAGALFVFGLFYVLKKRAILLIPLVAFYLLESVSLTVILESLELRKSLPHFMVIYFVVFWFIEYLSVRHEESKGLMKIIKLSTYLIPVILVIWNFR